MIKNARNVPELKRSYQFWAWHWVFLWQPSVLRPYLCLCAVVVETKGKGLVSVTKLQIPLLNL